MKNWTEEENFHSYVSCEGWLLEKIQFDVGITPYNGYAVLVVRGMRKERYFSLISTKQVQMGPWIAKFTLRDTIFRLELVRKLGISYKGL